MNKIVATLALGLVSFACMSSDPKGDVGSGAAKDPDARIVARDNRFIPADLETRAGRKVTVEIVNEGDSPHEFKIDALDLNTGTIASGEVAHATFEVPEGATEFVCSFHGGMRGEIVGS